MAIKEIRGNKFGYDDTGDGDALILIHGHPFDRSLWREQTAAFGAQYRIIAPDLRGYGESETNDDKTMLEEFARDIAALLDRLKVENIVLCGLSMGGQIALAFYQFSRRKFAL